MFISFWLVAAASATENISAHHLQRDELTIARNMVMDVFARVPHIDYIVWICPASFSLPDHIAQLFSPVTHDSNEDEKIREIRSLLQGLKVMVLHRSRFLPRLQVRSARVEDNDDLLPIIHHSNPEILDGQDHYFLADLIHRADEKNRFFVGLNDHDRPVGLLATSLDVNMALIMKIFDIDSYPDLVIRSDHLPPSPPLIIGIVGDLRLLDLGMLNSHLSHDQVLLIDCEKSSIDWKQYGGSGLKSYVKDQTTDYYSKHFEGKSEDKIDEKDLLQAVILWGLPSSEDEASRFQSTIINDLDVILELVNTSEEVEDDEEDEYLQRHLDGVEVLRESFFSGDEGSASNAAYRTPFASATTAATKEKEKKATWRKISFDKDTALQLKFENISRFYGSLTTCFDERNENIATERTRHLEKPPTANGFAITALCLDDMFRSRSMDLLKLAFEEQRDLDYCLFMLPNTTQPTIATRLFTFVRTRSGISFDQSLFILHRSYFLALDYLHLERMTTKLLHDDTLVTQQFVKSRPSFEQDVKLSIAENDVEVHENPSFLSFAVKMGTNHVIGVLVLSRRNLANEDVNWLRAHYHLDEQVNYGRHRLRQQYILQHWVLDPLFTHFTRLILQHVMRLCHKTLLYYHPLLMESGGGQEITVIPPKEILEEFAFIRPRRRAQGEHQPFRIRTSITTKEEEEKGSEDRTPQEQQAIEDSIPKADSPLFLMTKNQLSSWKVINAQRLVIAGGSTQSWSCLETIVSVPGVYYPNLFLVLGLPPKSLLLSSTAAKEETKSDEDSPSSALEDDLSGCLSLKDVDLPLPHELKSMGYVHRAGIVKGHMTDIDREHHAVVISDELVIEFDYLLISTPTIGKPHLIILFNCLSF